MGYESKSRQIGEHNYQVSLLPGKLGRKILLRLLKVAAPIFDGAGKEDAEMFTSVATSLDDDLVELIEESFARVTMVSTESGGMVPLTDRFNQHFAGNYADWLQWVVFCLEVNYQSFLAELVKRLKERSGKKEQSTSKSPKE